MPGDTKIEWADATWNPVLRGGQAVTPLVARCAKCVAIADREAELRVGGERLDVMGAQVASAIVAAFHAPDCSSKYCHAHSKV